MDKQIAEAKPVGRKSLIEKVANRFGVDANKMLDTLKVTAFRQKGDTPITNEQMMALLVVADQYKLNPWTKELYAFPDGQNGIVPIVGVDGWSRLINDHKEFDGMEFNYAPDFVQIDEHAKLCPEWIECVMYRKDRKHAIKVTEYLDETYREPFVKKRGQPDQYVVKGPWQSHTKRMLRHKVMIQCARIAFGYTGIYDQDEAERIVESDITIIEGEVTVIEDPPQKGAQALKDKLKKASDFDPPEKQAEKEAAGRGKKYTRPAEPKEDEKAAEPEQPELEDATVEFPAKERVDSGASPKNGITQQEFDEYVGALGGKNDESEKQEVDATRQD